MFVNILHCHSLLLFHSILPQRDLLATTHHLLQGLPPGQSLYQSNPLIPLTSPSQLHPLPSVLPLLPLPPKWLRMVAPQGTHLPVLEVGQPSSPRDRVTVKSASSQSGTPKSLRWETLSMYTCVYLLCIAIRVVRSILWIQLSIQQICSQNVYECKVFLFPWSPLFSSLSLTCLPLYPIPSILLFVHL